MRLYEKNAVNPPAPNAADAATAAPVAPSGGIRARSSPMPTTRETNGGNDARAGDEAASRAFVKTSLFATKPIVPAISQMNGTTAAR